MGLLSGIKLSWLWINKLFETCPKRYKLRAQDGFFILCGHRGSPTREIENTIPSFELAMKEGANSVETDLCITKDKVVILWHDWDPNDTVALLREQGFEPDVKYKPFLPGIFSENRKDVSQLTYDQFTKNYNYIEKSSSLPATVKIPTLKDFFEWAVSAANLYFVFFDLKVPANQSELAIDIISRVKQLVDELNPAFKIFIETFEENILILLKQKFPEYSFSYDTNIDPGIILLPGKYSGVKKAIKYKNDITVVLRPRIITIANWVTYRRLIRHEVRKQKSHNKKHPESAVNNIIGCTINSESEMDCLIRIGINGMQTDYTDKLLHTAEKYRLKISSD